MTLMLPKRAEQNKIYSCITLTSTADLTCHSVTQRVVQIICPYMYVPPASHSTYPNLHIEQNQLRTLFLSLKTLSSPDSGPVPDPGPDSER